MWRSAPRSLRAQCGSYCLLTIQGNKRSDEGDGQKKEMQKGLGPGEHGRLVASQEDRLFNKQPGQGPDPHGQGRAEVDGGRGEQEAWKQLQPSSKLTCEFTGPTSSGKRPGSSQTAHRAGGDSDGLRGECMDNQGGGDRAQRRCRRQIMRITKR